MNYGAHESVLFNECLDFLGLNQDPLAPLQFADLTFGAGGHTLGLLKRYPHSQVIAFDQDPEAIENGKKLLEISGFSDRVKLIHANFSAFSQEVAKLNVTSFDGILIDLGVSSHQFDSPERGFSFRFDAQLDMRMNPSDGPTGADLINSLSEEELADIFYFYGEERYARKIAKIIVEKRSKELVTTTKQLENIVFHSYPPSQRHGRVHPATRVFQALRIAVNDELEVIKKTIEGLADSLAPTGGILAVISFHSLEDRIVKHKFKEIVDKHENQYKILTKKPILPSDEEVERNPRSRSAKLRVLRREINYGGLNGDQEEKFLFKK